MAHAGISFIKKLAWCVQLLGFRSAGGLIRALLAFWERGLQLDRIVSITAIYYAQWIKLQAAEFFGAVGAKFEGLGEFLIATVVDLLLVKHRP